MHRFFEPLPEANNKRVTLSKETRKKLKNAFGKYTATFTHQISLISTLPYVAKNSLGKDKKLNFMDVISILSLVYGNSPEYGLKRQPVLQGMKRYMDTRRIKRTKRSKKNRSKIINLNMSQSWI
jgi:hypothetical protein